MEYCKEERNFSLKKEFEPGEFKIVDYILEYVNDPAIDGKILFTFRLLGNDPYIPEIIFEDYIYPQVEETDQFTEVSSFFSSKKAAKEVLKIYEILKKKGFIRKDDISTAIFIAALVTDEVNFNDIFETIGDSDLMRKYYETIKPAGKKEVNNILKILRKRLSPNQYELMEFCLSLLMIKRQYYYTDKEEELLKKTAKDIKNLAASEINVVMDYTLF